MANLNFQKNRIVCSFRKDVNKSLTEKSYTDFLGCEKVMNTIYDSNDNLEKAYHLRSKQLSRSKF